jgi:PAS domain S-box-containing protein
MTPYWSLETYRIHEVDPSLQPDLESAINFYAPEARPVIREAVQRAIEEGQSYDLELPFITAKGRSIWVRTMGQAEFRDGKCVRLFGMFQDITERRQAEQALRRFELLSENSRDIILFMSRADGRILEANAAAVQAYGYSREELLALTIRDLRARDTQNLTPDQMAQADAGGILFETVHLRKGGGTFPVEVSSQGATIGSVRTLVSIIRDITERKMAEEEREKLIAELTAKNAELERFAYTVSHDLKSPLVTIKGFLGYIEHDTMTGNVERLKSDTRRIANAVEKMQDLLDDLLEISRIGRLVNPSEIVLFEELVHEALGRVEGRIRERGVTVELQEDLPAVFVDKPRLIEALQNLLDNAAKYMGAQPQPRIEIGRCDEEDGKPLFYVKDNGTGIEPAYRERIFGLFNKLDPLSEGTGIGLTLVRRIIEFHGGRIYVESEVGKGSAFCFTLPTRPGSDSVI